MYWIVAPPALPLRSSCGNSTGGAAVTALGPNLHSGLLLRADSTVAFSEAVSRTSLVSRWAIGLSVCEAPTNAKPSNISAGACFKRLK